jgi:hypothetical protein
MQLQPTCAAGAILNFLVGNVISQRMRHHRGGRQDMTASVKISAQDVTTEWLGVLWFWFRGGGMRRKRRHTLLKIINRLSADALSGMGSRTVRSISSVYGPAPPHSHRPD